MQIRCVSSSEIPPCSLRARLEPSSVSSPPFSLSLFLHPVEGFIREDRRFLPPHQQPRAGVARSALSRNPSVSDAHAAISGCTQVTTLLLLAMAAQRRASSRMYVNSVQATAGVSHIPKLHKRETTPMLATSWDTKQTGTSGAHGQLPANDLTGRFGRDGKLRNVSRSQLSSLLRLGMLN